MTFIVIIRRIVLTFLLLISSGIFLLIWQDKVLANILYQTVWPSACDTPRTYRVDFIDERFGVKTEQFLKDIEEATLIWEGIYGQDLFAYNDSGELSINLVYDERQQLTSQIRELESGLSAKKGNVGTQIADYEKRAADFNSSIGEFNKQVDDWNRRGGGGQEEYDRLIKIQEDLKNEADQLNEMAKSLNRSTDALNSDILNLNKTIDTFNEVLSVKPEEGVYIAEEKKIEIYFNVDRDELVHTLAHETGHALGMVHVGNGNAIMFPSTNKILRPAGEDISQLQELCKRVAVWDILLRDLQSPSTYVYN